MAENGEGMYATTDDVKTTQPFCFSRIIRPMKW